MHPNSLFAGLLLVWVMVAQVGAQGVNKYYTGPGTVAGVCPIGTCSAANSLCTDYQWVSGCSFNFSGTCTACTGIQPGKYFSSSNGAGLTDNCVQTSCTPCNAGSFNTGCSATSAGTCSTCAAGLLPVNNYWTVPASATVVCPYAAQTMSAPGYKTTGATSMAPGTTSACTAVALSLYFTLPTSTAENCVTANRLVCDAGKKNMGSSTISAGACQDCTAQVAGTFYVANTAYDSNCPTSACFDTDCVVGQYKMGCTGASLGTCASCTGANASQVYVSKGSWSNACLVDGCAKVCPTGQYISNCGVAGVTTATLTCSICTNVNPNVNFYLTQGTYTPGSCTVNPCMICANGNFLVGCGSAASSGTSRGICNTCTNTV
jgi:hypothetical protein